MTFFLILALIILVLVVIFAVQNTAPVVITFFAWQLHTNLSVALMIACVLGALIILLLTLPGSIRNGLATRSNKKRIAQLESERDGYIASSEEAKKEVANLEEQLASYTAVLEQKMVDHPGDDVG